MRILLSSRRTSPLVFDRTPPLASLGRQQTFDLRDRMMSEVLGHLGNDLGFGFLCKLASEIAENFRRRHDHKLVERAGQGNLIDPVRN
jgi:hypothetical protein